MTAKMLLGISFSPMASKDAAEQPFLMIPKPWRPSYLHSANPLIISAVSASLSELLTKYNLVKTSGTRYLADFEKLVVLFLFKL